MMLSAWDDRLAIYRPKHSALYLGVTVCRGYSVSVYRLGEFGQWISDGTVGYELLGSGPCPAFPNESPPPINMAGDGETLVVVHGLPENRRLDIYHFEGSEAWFLGHTRLTYGYDVNIIGDTVIHYKNQEYIGLMNSSGFDIDSVYTGTVYTAYSSSNRTMEVSGSVLAIAQNGEMEVPPTSGRVVLRLRDDSSYPISATLVETNSNRYGHGIRFEGNWLVVLEGGYAWPARLFAYWVDTASGFWAPRHQVELLGFDGALPVPFVDINDDGDMIMTLRRSWSQDAPSEFEVSVMCLENTIGIPEDSPDLGFTSRREGSVLWLCGNDWPGNGTIVVYDPSGRAVATTTSATACSSGFSLGELSSGLYIVAASSYQGRTAIKLQW
jgi:hypothetical protein